MLHFNWLPSFFGLRQAHLHYFQRCKTSIEEWLFKVLNEKTHLFGKNCWLLAKYGSPPLALKKLQTPLETHLLTTIDPPWPKARGGSGICKLMQPLPEAEGHANLWFKTRKVSKKVAVSIWNTILPQGSRFCFSISKNKRRQNEKGVFIAF